MTPTTQPAPMRAFVVTVRGLQYVAMARSACMAVLDAHALHGVVAVAVKPLRTGKGAARRPSPATTITGTAAATACAPLGTWPAALCRQARPPNHQP